MKNNPELLKNILDSIKKIPNDIIEKALDDLSEEIIMENTIYNSIMYLEKIFDIESENKEWMEELALAA